LAVRINQNIKMITCRLSLFILLGLTILGVQISNGYHGDK
jgi:hypothetical protein